MTSQDTYQHGLKENGFESEAPQRYQVWYVRAETSQQFPLSSVFVFFLVWLFKKGKTRVYASVRAHVFRAAHRATATRSSESPPCIEGTPFPSAAYPFAWDLSFLSPPELRQQGIWVLLGATLFPAVALIVGCLCLFVHNIKDQQ